MPIFSKIGIFCYNGYIIDIKYTTMDEFTALYHFVDLAQKNRKYPANTAQGRRAALKLFQTILHPDELESLDLIKERMKDIYLSLITKYRDDFSIQSLNTYKGRFLKVIEDYKKYGNDPEAFGRWEAKNRRYKIKDTIQDTQEDTSISNISLPIHRDVYKIKITLEDGQDCAIELPIKLTKEDVSIIIKIINSLAS